MKAYLKESDIINFSDSDIKNLAHRLAAGYHDNDTRIAKNCFEYVRDEIYHSGDYKNEITTCQASQVLKHKTGWCYAKSHLLVALLRANGIPAGFWYQRLSCSEYKKDIYCLHGLTAIYLKEFGWYRVDSRGNKDGVDAQFMPPSEKLAFSLGEDEFELREILEDPLPEVVLALQTFKGYDAFIKNFPDVRS